MRQKSKRVRKRKKLNREMKLFVDERSSILKYHANRSDGSISISREAISQRSEEKSSDAKGAEILADGKVFTMQTVVRLHLLQIAGNISRGL